jgi:putative ABC transport system permease protein
VTRYALRAIAAHLRAAPLLFALAVLGVALGVASVLSIQILNRGALAAFEGTLEVVSGGAQVSVLPRAGTTVDEGLLPEVLAEPGVGSAVAVVRAEPVLAAPGGGRLEVVGVDLLSPARGGVALPDGALAGALGSPGWIAVTPALATALRAREGSTVDVVYGTRRAVLHVGALVDLSRAAPGAPARLALMDVAQAQALFGSPGRLSEIAVRAAAGSTPRSSPGASRLAWARRRGSRPPGSAAARPRHSSGRSG